MEARRRELLSAAIQVFARFGYRRASMNEVARAAQLSRQGLYFHFPTKEALFREAVMHVLEESFGAGKRAIEAEGTIEDRLVAAFDAVHGPFVGDAKWNGGVSHLDELIESSKELFGDVVRTHEEKFLGVVAGALTAEGIAEGAAKSGVSARDLALTLEAVAIGLKHCVASRDELESRMRASVRAVCRMPIAKTSRARRK